MPKEYNMAVYLVTREGADKDELPRMVESRTAAGAINHVAKKVYGAQALSTREAVAWSQKGVEIEDPKAED